MTDGFATLKVLCKDEVIGTDLVIRLDCIRPVNSYSDFYSKSQITVY